MRATLTSSELRPWWRRVGPWAGIATSPVALMAGGGIAESNAQAQLLVAVLCGVGLLTLLAATQGMLGTRRRAGFSEVAAASLGSRGARLVASPVIALMMAGWCGFNVSIAGAGLGTLLGLHPRIGVLLFAATMLAIAWNGLDTLSLAALVAGGATVVLAIVGVRLALGDHSGQMLAVLAAMRWEGRRLGEARVERCRAPWAPRPHE